MDPENKAAFDDSLDQLAAFLKQPAIVERADALALELMPLVEAALAEALTLAASELPGGPLLALGLHAVLPLVEERIRAWIAKRAASIPPPAP